MQFKQKGNSRDDLGRPLLTASDSSNPWWTLLEEAIKKANGKIGKPEIFPASTDACYFRQLGLPAIGFSPMAKTPILLHDHNEVHLLILLSYVDGYTCMYMSFAHVPLVLLLKILMHVFFLYL